MKIFSKIFVVSIVLIVTVLTSFGCSKGVAQEDYDSVKNELNDIKLQAQALQDKLDKANVFETQYQALKSQYDAQSAQLQGITSDFDDLTASFEQLKAQDESGILEIQSLQTEYDALNLMFEDLMRQYDTIVERSAVFNEEEINQALFDLINEERKGKGLVKLEWGVNLSGWARQNSVAMSQTGDFKYSSWLSVQAVLITAGQGTFDGLVNGIMEVWRQRTHEYEPKILNTSVKYGAVATIRSGSVYYVTYLASTLP
ncbi:MAG: hypothetical protein A2Y92_00700 [Chloroflexi bacterium RBG_13_57_8]|nr:MAG: hypothetical protein A2Y92_00700 [Chloroflexi bacterium RBG_13_57_8]